MNIQNFKRGDIITRTEPSLAIFGGVFGDEQRGDRSYMGRELRFIGIANNHIYFKSLDKTDIAIFGDNKIFDLAIDAWSEGWEYYINPESLLEENTPIIQLNKKQLEDKLQKAIDSEDYELAEKIRIQLSSL